MPPNYRGVVTAAVNNYIIIVMKKFNKLSRAEMKTVVGGNYPIPCIAVCDKENDPQPPFGVSVSSCEVASTACWGYSVISCRCSVLNP
jgi:hypothetical protein